MKPPIATMSPAEEVAWREALCAPVPHAGERFCGHCDAWLPLTEEHWYLGAAYAYPQHRACVRATGVRYRAGHAEKLRIQREQRRSWQREYNRDYWRRNSERIKARRRQQREATP